MPRILIAVDGSELSLDAVHHVLQLAQGGLRVDCVLANVQEPASLYELVVSRDPDLIAAASLEAGDHLMASARALLDAAGLAYTTEIGVGDPANTLVDIVESTGCDMVVIGARGQGALSSALLGSVSQALVHASPVPVTIVKHPEVLEAQDDLEGAADAASCLADAPAQGPKRHRGLFFFFRPLCGTVLPGAATCHGARWPGA